MNPFKKIPKTGLQPAATSPLMYRILGAGEVPAIWQAPILPEIGNQAVQNCLVWALAYCHEMATGEMYSRGYLYGERAPEDWQGQGLDPAQTLANLKKYGNVLKVNWNREDEVQTAQQKVSENSETLRMYAAEHPIKAYYLCSDVTAIKAARIAGLGVIFGAALDRQYTDKDGVFPCVNGRLGFHAMTVIDWSTDYPAMFRVANSWGTNFGLEGYCYMSAADILRAGMVYAVEFAQPVSDCPNCPVVIEPAVTPIVITRRTLKLTSPRMKDEDGYTDVSEFQTMVNTCGIFTPIDGRYGSEARAACVRFQQMAFGKYADEVDGICAGNTWAALDKLSKIVPDEVQDDEVSDEIAMSPAGELIAWALEQVGQMYLLGAQGEKVYDGMVVKGKTYTAQEWIRYRERASDKYFNKALCFYNILVSQGVSPILAYDCSGLLVCKLILMGIIDYDTTAHGLYRLCENYKKTTTNWRDCQPGWFCFQKKLSCNAHHVGLYIGPITWNGVYMPNAVLECKGRDDGVVIRDMRDNGRLQWNRFGVLPELDDSI